MASDQILNSISILSGWVPRERSAEEVRWPFTLHAVMFGLHRAVPDIHDMQHWISRWPAFLRVDVENRRVSPKCIQIQINVGFTWHILANFLALWYLSWSLAISPVTSSSLRQLTASLVRVAAQKTVLARRGGRIWTHHDMKKVNHETITERTQHLWHLWHKAKVLHTFPSFRQIWPVSGNMHAQIPDLHDLGLSGANSCAHGEGLSDGSAASTDRWWSLRWTYSRPILTSSQRQRRKQYD